MSEGRAMQEQLPRRWKCTGLLGRSSASCVRGISASDLHGRRKCRRIVGTIPAMHVRTILADTHHLTMCLVDEAVDLIDQPAHRFIVAPAFVQRPDCNSMSHRYRLYLSLGATVGIGLLVLFVYSVGSNCVDFRANSLSNTSQAPSLDPRPEGRSQ